MTGIDKVTLNGGNAQTIIPLANISKLKAFVIDLDKAKPLAEFTELSIN